jgi:hypothetical protein
VETIDFLAPFFSVKIGDQEEQLNKFDIWSSKDNPTDYCVTEVIKGSPFTENMPVELSLGYRDNWVWHVFSGYVTRIRPQTSTVIIEAKDEMLTLINTKVKQSFINALPQEIIRFGLKAAGIKSYVLSTKSFERKSLNVPNLSVKEMIEAVNRMWGLTFPFYFNPEKMFFWKETEVSSGKIAVFEYGKNIIDIEPFGDTILMTTFLVPFIGHSEHIKVVHPEYTNEIYSINKVRWYTNEAGFPRTRIYMEVV